MLDPPGHVGVGRPAVGRAVFEPTILRGVVRRSVHNAVGQSITAGTIMDEYGMRDDRGRREPVASLDYCRRSVACQDFECGTLGRSRERVRVFAHVEGAIGLMRAAIVTDGL